MTIRRLTQARVAKISLNALLLRSRRKAFAQPAGPAHQELIVDIRISDKTTMTAAGPASSSCKRKTD
jgi:hypothetical protein